MHCTYARFEFTGVGVVEFFGLEGKWNLAEVSLSDGSKKSRSIAINKANNYKACVTHASELLRQLVGKPPQTNFESQRRNASVEPKPLKVFRKR